MRKQYFLVALAVCFIFMNVSYGQDEQGSTLVSINTGDTPGCYAFIPKYDRALDNYLAVRVGGNADVVIKLVEHQSDACVRYLFISSGDEYMIRNIPPGIYYLKIAFGNDWSITGAEENCTGRFMNNTEYKIGSDLLDFNPVAEANGMQIPSYQLYLEIVADNSKNEFETKSISESEFQN